MNKLEQIFDADFRRSAMVKRRSDNRDRSRTLFESAVSPDVLQALRDWVEVDDTGVLIGGMALSYYTRPRYTEDADFLFKKVPQFAPDGFKKLSDHRFEHKVTGVVLDINDAKHIGIDTHTLNKVFETAVVHNGIKICSPVALVVLKLGRFSKQDQADIEAIVQQEKLKMPDFFDWNLDELLLSRLSEFI
jgi:hypothetical protein